MPTTSSPTRSLCGSGSRPGRAGAHAGWLALGLAAGLATAVRNQNAMLVVFPCLELLWGFVRALRGRGPGSPAQTVGHGVLLALGAFVAFLPQMLVWRAVFGAFLLVPQQVSLGVGFDWTSPHLWDALFSSRGPFVWHPVLLLGLIGLAPLYRRRAAAGPDAGLEHRPAGLPDRRLGHVGGRHLVRSPLLSVPAAGLSARAHRARALGSPPRARHGAGGRGQPCSWSGMDSCWSSTRCSSCRASGQVSIQKMVENQFMLAPAYLGKTLSLILSRFGR